MLDEVKAGPFTIRGVSLGGIYTCLHVPELHALFDFGLAPRSVAGARCAFLSHAHVDHAGALPGLLGLRALVGKRSPLRVFMPREIVEPMKEALAVLSRIQRYDLEIEAVPMSPGESATVHKDLSVRAFRTYHPVPSLGYQLFRRVKKLRPQYHHLTGPEIRERRRGGADDLFEEVERPELAYATDTLVEVLDREPSLFQSRVLVLECTFLDERKTLAASREGCHIHLDELLERADSFANEALVLMHFSQLYKPGQVVEILDRRCPPSLRERVIPFVPARGDWFG